MDGITQVQITPLQDQDQEWVSEWMTHRWGSPLVVSRGLVHDTRQLPGFVARRDLAVVGLVTYRIDNQQCEIVSLDSLEERCGIGTAILWAVQEAARQANCFRIWLITTNDKLNALGFYQRRGFHLAAIYPDAVKISRQLKPSIPDIGLSGIPIRDEIELELAITAKPD